jgi:hypothetical protein
MGIPPIPVGKARIWMARLPSRCRSSPSPPKSTPDVPRSPLRKRARAVSASGSPGGWGKEGASASLARGPLSSSWISPIQEHGSKFSKNPSGPCRYPAGTVSSLRRAAQSRGISLCSVFLICIEQAEEGQSVRIMLDRCQGLCQTPPVRSRPEINSGKMRRVL